MAELENGRRVCDLCRREGFRFDFESGRIDGGLPLAGYVDDESVNDICDWCAAKFLDDCLDAWVRKQQSDNEVIGGYRRGELAYDDEYMDGCPSKCERCGDRHGWTGGCRDYIVLPGGKEITLCHDCHEDWYKAADVKECGERYMSPAAVSAFHWRGVESQDTRRRRAEKAQREVRKQQGDKCADCGIPDGPGIYFRPWPREQPDGFVMVCRPCALSRNAAAAE